MSRMFTPEPELSGAPNAAIPESPAPVEVVEVAVEAPEEFEFVLGRRQIASVSLVVLTLIGACTAAAYIAGKSVGKVVTVEAAAPKPLAQAPVAAAAKPQVSADILDAPLGGSPEQGRTYIQLASVDRGFAALMVHGARKLGFPAFVAPGASDKVYRVLSGPFKNAEELEKAKATFAAAGLETFVRKIQAPEAAPKTDASAPEQP
jgi:hypothetical protein